MGSVTKEKNFVIEYWENWKITKNNRVASPERISIDFDI